MAAGGAADGDQRWLVDCLTATLDTARDVRAYAEESLRQASLLPGTLPHNYFFPLSVMVVIRQLLLTSLDDSHGKIRTAISMAVAAIGQQDWPEEWPELLPLLLKLISDQNNGNGVRGALRCLALLSDDLDNTCVPKLVPELFPSLYRIISSPHLYENSLRAKALAIVHSCISMLGSMSGVYKRDTISLMTLILDPLIEQFSIILNSPVQSKNPDDWSMQMEVYTYRLLFRTFLDCLKLKFLATILPSLWQTFVSSFKIYHLSSIQGSEDLDSVDYDSDGSERSLESFAIQLFELWTTIVGNSRLAKVIGGNLKDLAYYTIAFQQTTEEQVQSWSRDANQYVADEDDLTYSCRVSGSQLLEEIVTAYEDYGLDSILEASKMRFNESQELKQAGSADWWRLHEASLFALGSLSEQLCEAQDSGFAKYNVRDLLQQMLTDIMVTGAHQYPFLHARAFSIVAKFSSVISKEVSEQYLCYAARAIASDVALAQLLPESNQDLIQPNVMGILSSLVDLLRQASDETLHLVLETLQSAIRSGGEQSTLIEPIISPIILDVWAQHIADPFISIDAIEVLEAIKNAPGCLQPLVSRILPTIGSILGKPKIQPDGLVAGSLDLLTMVLKNAPAIVVKAVFDTCFVSTVHIVLESDDHGEMQNATECLAAFISGGRQELLVWGGEQGHTLKMLLDAASRLLDPALESSVHLSVPNVDQFIHLLLSIPAQGYDNSLVYIMSVWSQLQGKWSHGSEIQGAYQIKVTTTALALLVSTRHPELSKIEVQGHLIKTSAGITTRSKARVAPDQWTKIPLPAKIFSLLADTLAEIQEQMGDDSDDDCEEDSDWEEVQNGDPRIPDDIIYSASVPNANPSVEHLNAMAKVFDKDEDESYDDDLTKSDPLNEVKLADYLTNIFTNLWENDRPLFEYLCQSLSDSQRSAVEKVLRK
nr:unnamed protein product [Digitaria exilis]